MLMKSNFYLFTKWHGISGIFFWGLAAIFFGGILPANMQAQCDGGAVINISGANTGTWTAPSSGGPFTISITAIGGGGGNSEGPNQGGGGAEMIGEFVVQNSQVIFAISGGAGVSSTLFAGGGGGGSGVVNCGISGNCAAGTLLILAAGGNGGEFDGDGLGGAVTTGNGASGGGGGGNGGGGGGGLNAGGVSGTGSNFGTGGGQVLFTGLTAGGNGAGAVGGPDGGNGMGGGGGGGASNNTGSGGGAGHTGAAGGNGAAAQSFNSGTNKQNTPGVAGAGPSDGSVTVICLGALPVTLTDFKALIHTEGVRLYWSTATEKDNLGYDIERSGDNRNWTTLGFVPGNGTSTSPNTYDFMDRNPLAGVNYYRLKQMDTDGKYEYSPMVIADVSANALSFEVYPNPSATGALTFRTVSQINGEALLEIYDWVGYKVYKEQIQLFQGTMAYPVSITTYPKGAYTARLEMPDGTVHFRKIVLQ